MPLHLNTLSRREMLAGTLGAGASVLLSNPVIASENVDPCSFALLADTHIPSEPSTEARGVKMADHLAQVVKQLAETTPRSAGALINGDCAYLRGEIEDYALLSKLVRPLVDAKLPLHMTMGNHDDRVKFHEVLKHQRSDAPPVESKHVSVIETPHLNWILIDTLMQVNVVTGEVGAAQREWLVQVIKAYPTKPLVIVGHHNPQPPGQDRVTGIKDTEQLFKMLDQHTNVKAYAFGHTHNWNVSQRDSGLHLINLPPVAYVFAKDRPSGWVSATTHAKGIHLKLHSLDKAHPEHNQLVQLAWR
jgi:3',5'-cyclic AMP phosphodiesterase CpdA